MLRLMTYNVYNGAEADGRLDGVIDVVRAADPDVLIVPEANGWSSGALGRFEDATGLQGVVSPAQSGFDVALLVRQGSSVGDLVLRNAGFGHAAGMFTLELRDGTPFVVAGGHLSPFDPSARLREAATLGRLARSGLGVVLGDLNTLDDREVTDEQLARMPGSMAGRYRDPTTGVIDARPLRALEQMGFVDLYRHAADAGLAPGGESAVTAPTPLKRGQLDEFPDVRVDYVFGTRPVADAVVGAAVVRDAPADRASDHFPVVVDVDFTARRLDAPAHAFASALATMPSHER